MVYAVRATNVNGQVMVTPARFTIYENAKKHALSIAAMRNLIASAEVVHLVGGAWVAVPS